MHFLRATPILGALLAQALAALVLAGLLQALLPELAGRFGIAPVIGAALVLQALLSAGLTRALGLAVWWQWIALAFPFAVALALAAGSLPAWPFGLAFLLLYLFFSNTARERVPLYLSNRATIEALGRLMRERSASHFIDLGSGLGGVVRGIAGDGRKAEGYETAPMAFLISAILSKLTGRGQIYRRDIWSADITEADLVYVFLSPEPMPMVHDKARREMKPGSLLVSNSFAIPGLDADEIWDLSDRRKTRLYLYAMKG
jgi:hypothetical protein